MKRVFIYWGPHRLHKEWGELVCDTSIAIIPRFLPHSWRFNTVITQFFSVLAALYTPRADVYFLEGFNCIIPAYLRKKKGSKIIMINSDTTFMLAPKWKGIRRWLYKKMLPSIDGMISTSAYIDTLARKHHDVPTRIVHPYVDTRFFMIKGSVNNNLIQIGGLRDSKGTDLLINIFKALRSKLRNKLYLVGPVLEHPYAKVHKEEGITVTGWIDNPENYLTKAGIYMNLARIEPFGVNVLEGMAAGLIPIVSEHCGVQDAVKELDPSLVVSLDMDHIQNIVQTIAKRKDRAQLSKKAKAIASTYTREKTMKTFLDAFTALEGEL